MKILKQNRKMKDASVVTYNCSLPMGGTCPGAGDCRRWCYYSKFYRQYPKVASSHRDWLKFTRSPDFVARMVDALWRSPAQAFRWHDSGDIYSTAYFGRIVAVAERTPHVVHYMYTKSVHIVKRWKGRIPANLIVVFSLGGKYDRLININLDRHARIFNSVNELKSAGYVNASRDDSVAWSSKSNRIGLVKH
jgi:hypothetical protein